MRPYNLPSLLKAFIAIAALLLIGNAAHAANWYVRPSSAGSNTGTDWNNAWSMGSISWGSIGAGDTIWVAGGAHTTSLTNSIRGGVPGSPVQFRRVTAADVIPVAAPGWQASFDSQVTGPMSSINPQPAGALHDFIFDGRTPDGFKWSDPDGNTAFWLTPGNNISFKYCTWIGPGWGSYSGYGVAIFAGSGHYFGHCKFDGVIQQLTLDGVSNTIVEYCTFLNAGPGTTSAHSDMIYTGGGLTNCIFRYNYFYNSWSQAFFWDGGTCSGIYIYGNVADQGPDGAGTWFQSKQGYNWGDFHFYNNTMIGWSTAGIQFRGTSSSTSEVYNNLFFNTTWIQDGGLSIAADYNGYNSGIPSGDGPHSVNNTTNPFVNESDSSVAPTNFELVAHAWPTNKGEALTTNGYINEDMLGDVRGAGGAWDIGAFDNSVASATPAPPTNLRVTGR